MIVLLVSGVTAPVVAGLLAAGAMVLLGVPQAYRAISWTTVVMVGGMIPLSTAMQQTGAAEHLAHLLVEVVGEGSPYLLLLALAVLTATLGQLISNTATALIVIPIAVSAAADLGVSVRPVLMAVTVAAAAAFLTPGGDAGEPDGDGPRWVPLRRLLAGRPAPCCCSSWPSRRSWCRSSGRSDRRRRSVRAIRSG
jgi:di/tricarboxylate transporter